VDASDTGQRDSPSTGDEPEQECTAKRRIGQEMRSGTLLKN
jgi:hypothetical protein